MKPTPLPTTKRTSETSEVTQPLAVLQLPTDMLERPAELAQSRRPAQPFPEFQEQ